MCWILFWITPNLAVVHKLANNMKDIEDCRKVTTIYVTLFRHTPTHMQGHVVSLIYCYPERSRVNHLF